MSVKVKDSLGQKVLNKKFPRYFIVDGDILVKIDFDPKNNEVFAFNAFGTPYPPFKALVIGEEVGLEFFLIEE